MSGFVYVLLWVVLTAIPLMAAWKKQWLAFAVYAAGWLLFLYSVLQRKDGWDDLADLATFMVVVVPIYLVATVIWLFRWGRKRRRS
jgi:magnesium-transporting ATPase (P-type)